MHRFLFSGRSRRPGKTPRHRVCALALFDRILLDQLDHLAIGRECYADGGKLRMLHLRHRVLGRNRLGRGWNLKQKQRLQQIDGGSRAHCLGQIRSAEMEK